MYTFEAKSTKHSSLLRKLVNYGQKKFYNILLLSVIFTVQRQTHKLEQTNWLSTESAYNESVMFLLYWPLILSYFFLS
jgi:hypothetical protein